MGKHARGYQLAMQAVDSLRRSHSDFALTERDLAAGCFGWISADYATAVIQRLDRSVPEFQASEALIRELEDTDALIITTPMHNYTVPAALKLWVDLVLRHGRSFAAKDGQKVGLLADRPTLVIVASGGYIRGGKAKQPDHLTGYLTDVLATLGIHDIRFVYLEALAQPDRAARAMIEGHSAIISDERFSRPSSSQRASS